jgi:hypothetical protein
LCDLHRSLSFLAGEIVPGWVIRSVKSGVAIGTTPVHDSIVKSGGSSVSRSRHNIRVCR